MMTAPPLASASRGAENPGYPGLDRQAAEAVAPRDPKSPDGRGRLTPPRVRAGTGQRHCLIVPAQGGEQQGGVGGGAGDRPDDAQGVEHVAGVRGR